MEAIITIISAALAVASALFSVFTYYKTVSHDRKQATLEAYNRLQTEVFDKFNLITKKQIKEISDNPRSDEYKNLSKLLARIEHFCVGVNTEIYDVGVVERLGGKYFLGVYEKSRPLIDKKRDINKTANHYYEFELTIEKLRERYSKR